MSYSWSTEEYSDNYSTDFDTIEECIKEAKDMGCKAGTTIWIGKVEEVDIRQVDLTSILEDLHNAVYDDVGELAEDSEKSGITTDTWGSASSTAGRRLFL